MPLPAWLAALRKTEVVARVNDDARTSFGRPLGVDADSVRKDVICGGQADFDAPWGTLSADDRALLYGHFNQLGHLEELTAAFQLLFAPGTTIANPVVLDLGAGPCTAGLALAGVLPPDAPFTYIAVERASSMQRLGERLASAAVSTGQMSAVERHWHGSIPEVHWTKAKSWRPVIVVVSYLLASETVDAVQLVAELERFLSLVGRGSVTVLYTNSPNAGPNRSFPAFSGALAAAGFDLIKDGPGAIEIERYHGTQTRQLRYALFHRHELGTLSLGGA